MDSDNYKNFLDRVSGCTHNVNGAMDGRRSRRDTIIHHPLPTPLQHAKHPSSRKINRTKSPSPPPSGQRQSTLTQIRFVPPSFQRNRDAQITSDEELPATSVKRKRKRKSKGATNGKRRKDTLTQAHGFTSTNPLVVEVISDEESDLECSNVVSYCSPVLGIRAGSVTEILESSSQLPEVTVEHHEISNRLPVSVESSPAVFQTPKKRRFGDVNEIPSSQTPSTTSLSTQKTVRFRDAVCSPSSERSVNRLRRISQSQSPSRLTEKNSVVGKRVCFDSDPPGDTQDPADRKVGLSPPNDRCIRSSPELLPIEQSHIGNDEYKIDTQFENEMLKERLSPRKSDINSNQNLESQPAMLKRLRHVHERTRRSTAAAIVDTIGLRTPPDSSRAPKASTPDTTTTSFTPLRSNEDVRLRPTDSPSEIPSSSASHVSPPPKLLRLTTVPDSDDEGLDLLDDEMATSTPFKSCESNHDLDYLQNTYDPVNDALDRDAARFAWTQLPESKIDENIKIQPVTTILTSLQSGAAQSTPRLQHRQTVPDSQEEGGLELDIKTGKTSSNPNQTDTIGNLATAATDFAARTDFHPDTSISQNDISVATQVPRSPPFKRPRPTWPLRASSSNISLVPSSPPPPLHPSQVSTVVPSQMSPTADLSPKQIKPEPQNISLDYDDTLVVPSSPILAPPWMTKRSAEKENFRPRDDHSATGNSVGSMSDVEAGFHTAPSSPFVRPPNSAGLRESAATKNAKLKSVTQQLQSLADYSLPPGPPIWSSSMAESEL